MKNLLFHLKAVKTGTLKAQVGAGAEKNSFGSATLVPCYGICKIHKAEDEAGYF
jgi:hypothetical protein